MRQLDPFTFKPLPHKVIFHVDMNAFFATAEQAANPFLQGKPVAVVPGGGEYQGKAILARSYEAKDRGVNTFSRLFEARRVCPELISIPADPTKYYDLNRQLAEIMTSFTPQVEIYSIDEFFLDLTSYFKLHQRSFSSVAFEIKERIAQQISPVLTCSIGIGPNKLLAKVGSDFQKPDGLTEIRWERRQHFLDSMELGDIWGIGRHCVPKLAQLGIRNTADLRRADAQLLEKLVGSYWVRLKRIANGEYYDDVDPKRNAKPHKTMQHAHTMAKATADLHELKTLVRKQAERLAARLRKYKQAAGTVSLGIRPSQQKNYGWGYLPSLYGRSQLPEYTNNGLAIYQGAWRVFESLPFKGIEARLVVVGVEELVQTEQLRLLTIAPPGQARIDSAIDKINQKYGEFTVRTADILRQKAKESKYSVERLPMTFHPF